MNLHIGLMSGTSMDGIDAALVDLDTNKLIAGIIRPYSKEASKFLYEVLNYPIQLNSLSQLNTILGREFGLAVLDLLKKSNYKSFDIVAIGSHGQTICHDATASIPYTLQLGCPHVIAQMTGIQVAADFRTRDLVVGGLGAPFAPIYHEVLFGNIAPNVAIVNIGGISNVTFISNGEFTKGYDIGPGNCLMDSFIYKNLNKPYDKDGAFASTGKIINPLLDALLADPFFNKTPPKSIGKEYFSLTWLNEFIKDNYKPEDIQATLLALTAKTISNAILNNSTKPAYVILCGGGVHNIALQKLLSDYIVDSSVVSSAHFGVDPDFIEAMMFAFLAEKTVTETPLDLTLLTGSKEPVVLGALYSGYRFIRCGSFCC